MYNPSIHTATNKPIGLVGKPVDARTYYFDSVNFTYRPYVNTSEVLGYLNTAVSRQGNFAIIINTGGSLSAGVITGGTNEEWWFKNGTADGGLVLKSGGSPTPPDPQPITAGVDDNPLVIPYAGNDSTSYTLKRASDGSFDWNTKVQYDGTNFTVTGDFDDSGTKFADSFIFGIKP